MPNLSARVRHQKQRRKPTASAVLRRTEASERRPPLARGGMAPQRRRILPRLGHFEGLLSLGQGIPFPDANRSVERNRIVVQALACRGLSPARTSTLLRRERPGSERTDKASIAFLSRNDVCP
jgi:hypothetical protein